MATWAVKRVAGMVPTTLLAQKHYESFRDRVADTPVQVELRSRFRSGKQTSAALEKLRQAGLPFISVLPEPVYGGVSAALAMLGDVKVAEHPSLIHI